MSITKLPSGRYRSQVYDPRVGHNVSVSKILGGKGTFATKKEARAARERARSAIADPTSSVTATVEAFREKWLTDPLFQRPKVSTMIHNRERTRAFAERYGTLKLRQIDDQIVADWIAGGKNTGTIPALRAMFNDAASAKAGRLVSTNPFAGLGLERSRGNRDKQPPTEQMVWELIRQAHKHAGPYLAAWLQVACFTGMRPGELDALRWTNVDLERGRIRVVEQWSGSSRTFTLPKNGLTRTALVTPPAREALAGLAADNEFVFVTSRRSHWTPSARNSHWKAIRAGAGWDGSLYLASRHFAGWYMVNVLRLAPEDVAVALGHTDGGYLVRALYGHLEREHALDRVAAAYTNVVPIRRETA